jgi:DNA (cytosine-5)-methyltransferase 1
MNYLSICSGIESATVAWHPLGWQPLAFAEIEPFPSAVLAHHWPDVPNLGDMTKYADWPSFRPQLIVGGTPCQAFSVAGLRKGLADPRGNLTLTFLAILARYRPTWLVWENVPGVLSDKTGAFSSFLGGLAKLGYGWAYRVLDAQHFGVPQRRRRVFVVGYLGDWRRAAAVLFEPSCLRGDSPPRREAGQTVTPTIRAGVANGGPRHGARSGDSKDELIVPVLANCITARIHKGINTTCDEGQTMIAHSLRGEGFDASEDGTGRGTPIVPAIAFERRMVRTSGGQPQEELNHCLRSDTNTGDGAPCVASAAAVRRLTPRECERLQGFPDDHTLIPWRGKMAPDGPRYKALGNSMAVPVMRWIGERIQLIETLSATTTTP